MGWNSIRVRVLVWWCVALLGVATAIITISALFTFHMTITSARQEVITAALEVERDIRDQMEFALDAARTLAHAMHVQVEEESDIKLTRDQANAIIRQIVIRTPQIVGSCTQWEPNAFDGRDAEFVNAPMHDHTGMFIPYWFRRRDGTVIGEPLHDYENAEWWTKPRQSLQESIIEPYVYDLEGKNTSMMTFSVPIVHDGVFYGIGTADIDLDFIQQLVDHYKLFDGRASIAIISSGERLLASNLHPESRNRQIVDVYPHFVNLIHTARTIGVATHESNDTLTIVTQITFGNIETPWFAGIEVPMEIVVGSPRRIVVLQILCSMVCTIFGLILLWYLIGRITKPICEAAALAHKIKNGDLTQRLNIQRNDEIGQLGAALDSMTTSLQKRTNELTESRLKLAVTLDSIGDAVITTDTDCCITRMNPIAEQITGWTKTEAIGRPLRDVFKIINSKTRNPVDNPAEKVLSTNEIVGIPKQTILIRRDGDEFLIADSGAPIRSISGDTIGVVLVFRDMTNEYALEEKLIHSQKMDAIGQLAGGVAHDFNNMLGGIMGSCELLQHQLPEDPTIKKYLSMIFDASNRAADLASNLLAFSRRQPAGSTPIDIHTVIADTVSLLKNTIDKRIEIEVNLSAKTSKIIGDNTQLESVLLNLGINSSHAMPNGGVISYWTEQIFLSEAFCTSSPFDLTPGDYIQIDVMDNGCGIPAEQIPHIFEPFFTTKEQGKGTGLGLAAVYGTVKQHNGAISVYSEVGKGTKFCLFFPLTHKKAFTHIVQQDAPIRGEGLILLVDDEDIMRNTGKALLQELGYNILLAENGEEAIDVFRHNKDDINLVILDMVMPKMNGRDCFLALKDICPYVPIVLSSGFTQSEVIDAMRKQGLFGFIQKPFLSLNLSKIVFSAMQKSVVIKRQK